MKRKCAKATGLPSGGAGVFFLPLLLDAGFFSATGAEDVRSVTSAYLLDGSQRSSMSAWGFHLCPNGPRFELTSS